MEAGQRDAVLLYSKVQEGGPKLRRPRAASGSWKRRGNSFSQSLQREQAWRHLDFSSGGAVSASWPPDCRIIHLCGFIPLSI